MAVFVSDPSIGQSGTFAIECHPWVLFVDPLRLTSRHMCHRSPVSMWQKHLFSFIVLGCVAGLGRPDSYFCGCAFLLTCDPSYLSVSDLTCYMQGKRVLFLLFLFCFGVGEQNKQTNRVSEIPSFLLAPI